MPATRYNIIAIVVSIVNKLYFKEEVYFILLDYNNNIPKSFYLLKRLYTLYRLLLIYYSSGFSLNIIPARFLFRNSCNINNKYIILLYKSSFKYILKVY